MRGTFPDLREEEQVIDKVSLVDNFREEAFRDSGISLKALGFQNERLREDNDWLRECLSERMKDYRSQESLIINLRKDFRILSQKLEVAEGQRLYCENQIRGLEEQLDFFVMSETAKEFANGLPEETNVVSDSHKITAYIKLLQEKDDLLGSLRSENLALKGHVLDLTNSLEKIKMERELASEKLQAEMDHLRNKLKLKDDELQQSRKDIFKLTDLEQEFKTALLELEVLRDHKNETCDGEESFLRLREHLSNKVKENTLLQDKVCVLEGKVNSHKDSEYEEIEGSDDFNDKNAKFENKLDNLRNLLSRTAEEEGVEILLSNDDMDNYL